jgi:hypothetical protein
MWRILILVALGIVIGSRARSEGRIVLICALFGLLYGAAEVVGTTAIAGPPSLGRTLLLLGLGLVFATPVYAIAEIWRRTHTRALAWLRRLIGS